MKRVLGLIVLAMMVILPMRVNAALDLAADEKTGNIKL